MKCHTPDVCATQRLRDYVNVHLEDRVTELFGDRNNDGTWYSFPARLLKNLTFNAQEQGKMTQELHMNRIPIYACYAVSKR